ncbi:hypothetical protein [Avrilella dinanensis]|nr:hypothetical protein [Avrilella dinanensis]
MTIGISERGQKSHFFCRGMSVSKIATNGKRIGEVADKLDGKFNLAVT